MPKDITIEHEIAELKRELDTRKRVYPNWSRGPNPKIRPDVAAHRIACMEATLTRLERKLARIRPQQSSLF